MNVSDNDNVCLLKCTMCGAETLYYELRYFLVQVRKSGLPGVPDRAMCNHCMPFLEEAWHTAKKKAEKAKMRRLGLLEPEVE